LAAYLRYESGVSQNGKWITVLLGLNLAVLLLMLRRPASETVPVKPVVTNVSHFDRSTARPAPGPRVRSAPALAPTIVSNLFTWTQLETQDYRDYIQRLRRIGCPEETIRDLIIADIEKAYAPRLAALRARRTDLQFWHSDEEEYQNQLNHKEIARQERILDEEKRRLIRDLIGADLYTERLRLKGETDYYDRRLGVFPAEKRVQIRTILEQFHDQDWAIREKQWQEGETLTAEDGIRLVELRRAKEEALGKLLTADEREQLELWMSPVSDRVRFEMYGMNSTEEEFRKVFALRRQFEEKYGEASLNPAESATAAHRAEGEAELRESIKTALGEARYALYERGQDHQFHQLSALAAQFNLGQDKVAEIYAMQKLLRDHRQQVQGNPDLAPAQRNQVIHELQAETERSIRAALGDRAYREYQRSGLSNVP
jgi:hypothetical protein